MSLVYHRRSRKERSDHTQSFVLCNVDEETKDVGTKEVILESHRGALIHWSGSLRPGAYVVIPFSTSFWKTSKTRKDEKTRCFTLVIHSSAQFDGVLLNEPPTLLSDCLIAATIKFCDKSNKVFFGILGISFTFLFFFLCFVSKDHCSVLYVTSHRFDAKMIVIENQLTNHYLTFNMAIIEAENVRHSRQNFRTLDCIPPRHRQLICILEWTQQRGRMAHVSYVTSQRISGGWHHAQPPIAIDKDDLHSPRPF